MNETELKANNGGTTAEASGLEKSPSLDSLERAVDFAAGSKEVALLAAAADKARREHVGDAVFFRGVIEFSNACEKNCFYCGIRRGNAAVERYSMNADEVVECAEWAFKRGYGSVVLQSGEVTNRAFVGFVADAVREIKKRTAALDSRGKGVGVTLSVGEQSKRAFEEFFDAGAHRYLLRIETSNPALYASLHPKRGHSFSRRARCLDELKEIGFQVGTGVMIGLPGQSARDLARDLLFFKTRDVDMVGMGPYVANEETPLAWYAGKWCNRKNDFFQKSLNMVALARLLLRDVNIAATTALQALHPLGREKALACGANVVMPIITPTRFRKNYLLYDGKPCIDENAAKCGECLEARIRGLGRFVGWSEYGDSPHYFKRTRAEKKETREKREKRETRKSGEEGKS